MLDAFLEFWHDQAMWMRFADFIALPMLLFCVVYLCRDFALRIPFVARFFSWLFATSPFRKRLFTLFATMLVMWCGAKGWVYIQWDGEEGDIAPKMEAEYDEEFDVSLFTLDWSEAGYGSGAVSNTIPVWVRNASSNNWTRLEVTWTVVEATRAEFAMNGDETTWAQWYFGDDPPAGEIETQDGIEITSFRVDSEHVYIEWTAEEKLAGATFQIQYRTGSRDSTSASGGYITLVTTEENSIVIDRFTLDKFYEWRIAAEIEDTTIDPQSADVQETN